MWISLQQKQVYCGTCDSTFPVAECSATWWTERRFVLLYDARELFYYITQETARRQMKTNAPISPSLALSFSSSIFVSLLFLSKCNSLPRLLLKFHTRDCHANQNIIICSLLISFLCNVHVFLLSVCPATESTGTNSRRVLFQFHCNLFSWEKTLFYYFLFWIQIVCVKTELLQTLLWKNRETDK